MHSSSSPATTTGAHQKRRGRVLTTTTNLRIVTHSRVHGASGSRRRPAWPLRVPRREAVPATTARGRRRGRLRSPRRQKGVNVSVVSFLGGGRHNKHEKGHANGGGEGGGGVRAGRKGKAASLSFQSAPAGVDSQPAPLSHPVRLRPPLASPGCAADKSQQPEATTTVAAFGWNDCKERRANSVSRPARFSVNPSPTPARNETLTLSWRAASRASLGIKPTK